MWSAALCTLGVTKPIWGCTCLNFRQGLAAVIIFKIFLNKRRKKNVKKEEEKEDDLILSILVPYFYFPISMKII